MIAQTILKKDVRNFDDIYCKYLKSTDKPLEDMPKAYQVYIHSYKVNGGCHFRIISHNIFMLAVGFIVIDKQVNKMFFVYVTSAKILRIEL